MEKMAERGQSQLSFERIAARTVALAVLSEGAPAGQMLRKIYKQQRTNSRCSGPTEVRLNQVLYKQTDLNEANLQQKIDILGVLASLQLLHYEKEAPNGVIGYNIRIELTPLGENVGATLSKSSGVELRTDSAMAYPSEARYGRTILR
jgi:hypothetical protein